MIHIEYIGGNCPVQAEGFMTNGKPFYFRARWNSWSVGIGGDPIIDTEWQYEEPYMDERDEFGAAGWMTEEEAIKFICKAEVLYRLHRKRGTRKHI